MSLFDFIDNIPSNNINENITNVYKAKIVNNSIKILDNKIKESLDKVKLSPSMVGAILNSPGDWIMGKFIEPECQTEYTDALERGKWFHKIMEEFFKLPEEKRNYDTLKKVVQSVTKKEYMFLMDRQDNKEWLQRAIANYKNTWLSNAKNEKIAKLFLHGSNKYGLELFIDGKIGDAKRPALGFIDKIVEGENGLKVQDWKTGASIHDYDPSRKPSSSNPFDYWRQQTFYALLLEQKGMLVEEACLIFPCSDPPAIVQVDFKDENIRKMVIEDFEKADSILDECINNDYTFPFQKGQWNGWASYLCGLGTARFPKVNESKLNELVEL